MAPETTNEGEGHAEWRAPHTGAEQAEPENRAVTPIGHEAAFSKLMVDYGNKHRKTDGSVEPNMRQDGGHEIHPDLKGITFNFYLDEKNGVGLNYEGDAPTAPWSHELTGKVFENFGDAKKWLRQEATRLSKGSK